MVLEKTIESPLDCKEIQPVSPKGNESWIFIDGLMLKLKLQYFGHLMWRTNLLEKTLMLGKIEGGRRRGQQRMVGWYHQLRGHEFEQAPGVGNGQGSLVCYSPWGCKKLDTAECLNWTEKLQWGGLWVGHVSSGNKRVPLNMLSLRYLLVGMAREQLGIYECYVWLLGLANEHHWWLWLEFIK